MKQFFLLFLGGLVNLSCFKKGELKEVYKEFYLYTTYSNPGIVPPKLEVDISRSNKAITFPSTASFLGSNCNVDKICLQVNNITISDYLGAYEVIENPIPEEFIRGVKWEQDAETKFEISKTQSIDLVLTLDLSSSLGNDVKIVKQEAINLVEFLFNNITNAKVGVVLFSKSIQKLSLTNDLALIRDFISSGKENEDETKLYEAIDEGLTMLKSGSSVSRVLITFTDGRNNSWSANNASKYEKPDYVLDLIQKSGYPSYTIGLKGKSTSVDDALLDMACNSGRYTEASSAEELARVFAKIANSVSKIYSMTYKRNNSIQTEARQIRFKIKAKLYE